MSRMAIYITARYIPSVYSSIYFAIYFFNTMYYYAKSRFHIYLEEKNYLFIFL